MFEQSLSDSEWESLEYLFPVEKPKRGKPHTPWRAVVNSIRYILANNKWETIPPDEAFATKSVSNRYYREWKQNGLLSKIIAALGDEVHLPPSRTRAARIQTIANNNILIKGKEKDE